MTLTLDLGGIGRNSYETQIVSLIADAHPHLKIVICHLGQPTREDEKSGTRMLQWEEQLRLGSKPNVWFDISALPHKVPDEVFPWPSNGRWIRQAIEWIGAEKLLWGTDYPGLLTIGTYLQLKQQLAIHLPNLPLKQLNGILGENSRKAYSMH